MLQRTKLLIPNLITLCNLLCGFLSLVYSIQENFALASHLVLIGIILDFLDGFLARRLKAESKFGLEFDSLADFITFGIAPSFLVYLWALKPYFNNLGIVASFTYLSSIGFRLARFNSSDVGLIHFRGLPSPAAAMALALLPLTFSSDHLNLIPVVCLSVLFLLAALCSSRIVFLSLKQDIRITRNQKIWIALVLIFLWYLGWVGLFLICYAYVLSGPVIYFAKLLTSRKINLVFSLLSLAKLLP
jgi:CDP-diacylglycerol---serine O-phosphatidyltransferase